jgi:hypothetical protein
MYATNEPSRKPCLAHTEAYGRATLSSLSGDFVVAVRPAHSPILAAAWHLLQA